MTKQLFSSTLSLAFSILSIILVLSSWVIKISLVATILLEVTTLSKMKNLSRVIVFLARVACSVKSTFIKDTGIESTNVRIAKGNDVRDF